MAARPANRGQASIWWASIGRIEDSLGRFGRTGRPKASEPITRPTRPPATPRREPCLRTPPGATRVPRPP
jgi:hypothetical protein